MTATATAVATPDSSIITLGAGDVDPMPDRDLNDLEQELDKRVDALRELRRRSVYEGWLIGGLLRSCYFKVVHVNPNGWERWLRNGDRNIARRTADRYMWLHQTVAEADVHKYRSLSEAQRAHPLPPAPAPTPDDTPPPDENGNTKLTAAQKKLLENASLKQQAMDAEERAQELATQVREKQQLIEHLQDGHRVSEEYRSGVSIITRLQQEARDDAGKIARLETKVADLTSENRGLKRRVRQLERELEAATAN